VNHARFVKELVFSGNCSLGFAVEVVVGACEWLNEFRALQILLRLFMHCSSWIWVEAFVDLHEMELRFSMIYV